MSDNKVFPQPTLPTIWPDKGGPCRDEIHASGGLTKREMFAAMAMQGVLDCKLCGLCDALVRGAA